MKMRLTFSMVALAFTAALVAQAPAERAAAIKEALAKNAAALRQYSWVETTTISLKGEVKKQEQKQCYYGADGKVQKTPVPGQAAAPPKKEAPPARGKRGGGAVKGAIVENKVEDMKEYMEKAAALVGEYVPPDPQKIQAAQSAGTLKVEPAGGVTTLSITSYFKPNDSLAIGFDPAAMAMKSYNVKSYVEKPKDDDLTLAVTFAALTDGTSYPAQIVLDVAATKIQVKIANSGYKKTAP